MHSISFQSSLNDKSLSLLPDEDVLLNEMFRSLSYSSSRRYKNTLKFDINRELALTLFFAFVLFFNLYLYSFSVHIFANFAFTAANLFLCKNIYYFRYIKSYANECKNIIWTRYEIWQTNLLQILRRGQLVLLCSKICSKMNDFAVVSTVSLVFAVWMGHVCWNRPVSAFSSQQTIVVFLIALAGAIDANLNRVRTPRIKKCIVIGGWGGRGAPPWHKLKFKKCNHFQNKVEKC